MLLPKKYLLTKFFSSIAEQTAEQIVRKKTIISPEDVLTLSKITEGNVY